MPSPYYTDAFLGGRSLPGLEDEALLPATIGTSSLALPGDRAVDAALRSPGAFNPDQTPQAGLTAAVVPPAPAGAPGASPAQQAAALGAIAPPPAPPPPTPQEAAQAALGMGPPAPPAAAPPAAKPTGPGIPFGSQAKEHFGALADEGEAQQAANRAQQVAQINHADLLDQQRDAADQRMVERAARRNQREQAVDQQMADLDKRITEASSQAYDSGKYFAQPGTMLMNIGAALGGGAAARVTGKNDAQAVLERGIDRDFQQWKAGAEAKQSGVREKANLVTQMRAAYGDRDQADLAAEVIHREMAASAIEAEAARSKVPEIKAQGLSMAAGVREKTASLKDKINANAVAAWNAAEARRRADEKEQFERGLKIAELEIKRKEAEAKAGGNINEQTGKIAAALQSSKIPGALASAERAKADLEEGASALTSNPVSNAFAQAFPLTFKFVAGDKASSSQMSYANFKNEILNQKGGAAISESELSRLLQGLENAGTKADKELAISNVIESLKRSEASIKAGASPEAAAEYDRRNRALSPTISSEAPKGFTPGVR
jgi:hypothetical protein